MDEMVDQVGAVLEDLGSKLGWTLGTGESGIPGIGILDGEAVGLRR